jgi:hypothetical protein
VGFFATLLVAVVTALAGGALAGCVANLCVGWYRISSFEGGSGYFVVFTAIAGFVAGLIIGVIAAQTAGPGLGRGLGASLLTVLLLSVAAAGISRAIADVPPTLDGESLILLVELRWPVSAAAPAETKLYLGALAGRTVRARREGALWLTDARQEDGYFIAPGAVDLFTNRGARLIWTEPKIAEGLLLPMRTPSARDLQWSGWLGAHLEWRYKVIHRSEPSRVEKVGSFQVETIENTLVVRNASAVVRATAVATLPGDALLAAVEGECLLLEPGKQTHVASSGSWLNADPLGNDDTFRSAVAEHRPAQGQIDRVMFMRPGSYLFNDAIFDSVTRAIRPIHELKYQNGFNVSVPPLGISPGGRGIVRAGFSESEYGAPALLVFDTEGAAPDLVAIDRAATRYGGSDSLSNAWLNHYYEWRDGRLVARAGVVPWPYRGYLHTESTGNVVYQVQPAGNAMKDALAAFLAAEFKDAKVTLFYNDHDHSVVIYANEPIDKSLVPLIAGKFNAVLATGKYDGLFDR